MLTFYLCFLAGGAVIPIVSFLLGFLGNEVDSDIHADMDIDTEFDLDIDTDMDMDMSIDTDMDGGADIPAGLAMGVGLEGGSILSIGLVPTSIMSVSALAITFGAVGGIMTHSGIGKLITFSVSVLAGYFASVIVQTIIKTLKKVQRRNDGINEMELLLYDGKVIDTILPGKLGTVSITTVKNIMVNYPAKCVDESLRLETGRIIKVIEIKDGIFLVEPKNKYE